MIPSNFNLFCPISHSKYSNIVLNFLVRNFDFLTSEEIELFRRNLVFIRTEKQKELATKFFKKGYIYPNTNLEKNIFNEVTESALQTRSLLPVYISIVLNYICEPVSDSCYFKDYNQTLSLEQLDKIFQLLENKEIITEKNLPIIALEGGEPLASPELMESIMKKVKEKKLLLQISTNGLHLDEYSELFKDYFENVKIDIHIECQEHISEKLIDNIENALNSKLYVALHVGVTKDNLKFLPNLANLITNKMWLYLRNFVGYVTPMHENMHNCQMLNNMDTDLTIQFMKLRKEYPQIEVFFTNGWHGLDLVDYMIIEKALPYARFYRCRPEFNFFSFAPDGLIYKCYEVLGKPEYSIGTYFPELKFDPKKQELWSRTKADSKCTTCSFYPLCGGGCLKLKIEKNEPLFNLPDCGTLFDSYKEAIKFYANDLIEIFTSET